MILHSEDEARAWLFATFGELTVRRLEQLAALLVAENQLQNLVSSTSLSQVWLRHFADSAQLLLHVPRETAWLDLGTGAGFPGLVIAICSPGRPIHLVESRRRRIDWLEKIVAELELVNVEVWGRRIETVASFEAGVISARAFASLSQTIGLSARFSTPDTVWVLPKGRNGRQELREMSQAVQRMFHVEQSITDAESVILLGKGRPPAVEAR